MRLLLDTHVLLWALADDPRLSGALRAAIEGAAEVHVSAATIWEIAIKRALGKLRVEGDVGAAARRAGCLALPIAWAHAEAAGALPPHHQDPFDRLLVAQARCEGLALATADRALDAYDVERV